MNVPAAVQLAYCSRASEPRATTYRLPSGRTAGDGRLLIEPPYEVQPRQAPALHTPPNSRFPPPRAQTTRLPSASRSTVGAPTICPPCDCQACQPAPGR